MSTKEDKEYLKAHNIKWKPKNVLQLGPDKSMTTPVYRVFRKLEYFMQLFEFNENTLVKLKEWDDPWENFLLKQEVKGHPSGYSVSFESLIPKYYGQCWTYKEADDDALWRIYSPEKDGVRITTKLGKLLDSFYDLNNDTAALSYFMGEVNYLSESEIRGYFEKYFFAKNITTDQTGQTIINTLLFKREEFRHEKEVRIIHYTDNPVNPLFKYKIDPHDLIEEVLFDPRMDDALCKSTESTLRNKYGFKGPIRKSTLYQVPNLSIQWGL